MISNDNNNNNNNNNNDDPGKQKAKPPRSISRSGLQQSRSSSRGHSSSRRSPSRRPRSNSIGSRSHTSRTVRTIETVSTSKSGSYYRSRNNNGDYNNNTNTSHNFASQSQPSNNQTTLFDEPSALLGFNSITIDSTPKKKSSSRRSSSSRGRSKSTSRGASRGASRGTSRGASLAKGTYPSSPSNNSKSRSKSHSISVAKKSHTTTTSSSSSLASSQRGRSRPATSRSTSHSQRSRSSSKSRGYSQSHTSSSYHPNKSNHTSSKSTRSSSRASSRGRSIASRKRSSSRHSTTTNRKPRARSCSRQSRTSSKGDRSASILPDEIEPNVHHNAIMTLEVDGPVIAEMKENELFARKAGINFTKDGGDYLTLVNSDIEDTKSVQDEEFIGDVQFSPNHQKSAKNNPYSMLCEDGDFPPNATFLRIAGAGGSTRQLVSGIDQEKQMLGTDQDLAYLRDVAGQLFVKWRGKTSSALARRLRDFQFAQEKRRKKFGNEKPWGILGLYDHLAAVRADIEWAEDAACRRANGEPYKAWFEFVNEQGTGKDRPFFTYIILLLCTGFLIASIGVNEWQIEPFSTNPMIGPSATTLVTMGAKDSLLIVQSKEVWRLLSAMMLHAGLIHYLLNMLALWFIGSAVEKCHGSWASLLLFVAPAVGGTLMSAIFLPEYITVGASAGIFGLIGACLADICMNWTLLFNGFVNGDSKNRHTVVLLVLFLDIVVNSLVGLTPFVDNFAHLGGMLFGFLCGTSTMQRVTTDMFGGEQKRTFLTTLKQNVFRFSGIIITVAGMCTSLALLMNGDGKTSPCPSCDALSCMPFPPWGEYDKKWWYCDDCASVIAEARYKPTTAEYDQLTISCPGGETAILSLDDYEFETDLSWLKNKLPQLCRQHCSQVYE